MIPGISSLDSNRNNQALVVSGMSVFFHTAIPVWDTCMQENSVDFILWIKKKKLYFNKH